MTISNGLDIEFVFQLYMRAFELSCLDEKAQVYGQGTTRQTKGEIMESSRFQGYSSGLYGYPTPEKWQEGLRQRKPRLSIAKTTEPNSKRVALENQDKVPDLQEIAYGVMTTQFREGWDKGCIDRKIYKLMSGPSDETQLH